MSKPELKNLKDLSEATGCSRYTINRAVKAGLLNPAWFYTAPGSNRRKVHGEYFDTCVSALNRGWAPRVNSQSPGVELVAADSEEARAGVTLEALAESAGVTLAEVHAAIADGRIRADMLIEVEASPS